MQKSNHKVENFRPSLPIEKYRKENIDRKLRLCNKCTLNAEGDELHVLTECNNVTLTELRTKFYVKLLSISPQLKLLTSKSLLSYILSMCDVSICHVLSKFFFEVLKNY